jgi:16S rRNA (guanine527-N7)-methyltransferase
MDLGSGGGLPGLVLAVDHPGVRWVFIEARQQRAAFLDWAVSQLGLEGRVEVVAERAETLGRQDRYRETAQVITARSFGSPAVTAECGAPLLRSGGVLVVSEPPASIGDRWPSSHLEALGLRPVGVTGGIMTLEKVGPTDLRFPRRPGIPTKRPLF